jgi:hypothetical protein
MGFGLLRPPRETNFCHDSKVVQPLHAWTAASAFTTTRYSTPILPAGYINIMISTPCKTLQYHLTAMDGRMNGEGTLPCGNPRINKSTYPPGIYDIAFTTDYGKTFSGTTLRK